MPDNCYCILCISVNFSFVKISDADFYEFFGSEKEFTAFVYNDVVTISRKAIGHFINNDYHPAIDTLDTCKYVDITVVKLNKNFCENVDKLHANIRSLYSNFESLSHLWKM